MIESLILGAVQGIAEWLPVSSEAMVVLVKSNFFPTGGSFSEYIHQAIFLHIGTLLAAVIFFWKKVRSLIVSCFQYSKQDRERKDYLIFIALTTLISGALGLALIRIVEHHESFFAHQEIINSIPKNQNYVNNYKNINTGKIDTHGGDLHIGDNYENRSFRFKCGGRASTV